MGGMPPPAKSIPKGEVIMKKVVASVFALGLAGSVAGCGGLPGMDCKFNKGEVAAEVTGDAKAFVDASMDLKKTSDALEASFDAEIKLMAGELKVESNEEAVLAKISANVSELKAKGQCEITFEAKLEASASASGDASGKAGTGEGAKGGASGKADASATAEVKFDVKCKAEASVKANYDVTVPTIKAHFPKLLGVVISYKSILPKVKATVETGNKLVSSVSDIKVLPELKCAVSAATGIQAKVDMKVSFSVKAEASAKGEAKAGG